jgi:Zn-dependent metalloprotease
MKQLVALAVIAAAALVIFPRAHAQSRIFTSGTPAELEFARSRGLEQLRAVAAQRGIDDELTVSGANVDRLSMAHTRVQQNFRGVRVLGGEAIAHFRSDGQLFAVTDDLVPNISVNTTPRLTPAAAIDIAVTDYGCRDCLTARSTADLWILRDQGVDHLVYRVQMARLDGTNNTALPVRLIDAQGGYVVSAYDDLQTAAGSSLYSGNVTIGTYHNPIFGDYVMENHPRRIGTFNLSNTTSTASRFIDSDDVWDSPTQRAGVDAHFAMERYFSYLAAVHGRNGIDGFGGPFTVLGDDGATTLVASFVHYGVGYNNAFWNSAGNYMAYGDGDNVVFSPLVTVDIAGHEMTHGVTRFSAGLINQGESGALNESWSDVFGAMLERDVKGPGPNNWLVGEEAFTPGVSGDALRYMDDPHRAVDNGFTANDDPDHYTERYTGGSDNGGVHINSGISNKAFYLLAQGGTHHLGGSMTGIGADAAARIWFVALTNYMTSGSTFAGARTATLNAAAALYGGGSPQQLAVSAAWCLVGVGTCSVPTADSATPGSGSGTTQLFSLQYSDSSGTSNLATTWVWFSATQASAVNSCLINYARGTNTVSLLDDAGGTWMSATLGTGTTLQNSQCAIAVGTSGASPSGNTLTVNLAMTFKAAFGGAKNIYMYAANATGANSGWQDRGDWTVPAVIATITANSVTPSSGSGATQTFALQYSDSLGATDLLTTWVWFNATFAPSAANSCLLYYNRPTNTVFLLNDGATAWTSAALGSASTLQNNQCSISLTGSSTTTVGSTLTLSVAMTFTAAFNGAKNVYLYATNGTFDSGWHDLGDWTVPGVVTSVTADSVTPNSGSGATQAFAFAYSSTQGAADLSTTWAWFSATLASSAASSCLTYYDRPTNTVFLLNDAGTTWFSGLLGSATTLQNSQCSIALLDSSILLSGNTLTLTLAMTFKAPFNGARNIYMYASNGTANSGWQDRGDWTATGVGNAVTADSATPSSGSGSTQSFALAYSSTLGATNVLTTWVWFTPTLAQTAASSCLVYYDRPSNLLFLLDDAGTNWMSAVMGTATTLQNNQCAIAVGSSHTNTNGNTLTVTLAMTFSGGFAGAKNTYMYATNGVINSGWQDRGDWNVP